MKRVLAVLALVLAASPAAAHKLRLFAAVDGHVVAGYAWFVGGGRAQGTDWIARDADGGEIASGVTDAEGRYHFTAPDPVTGPISITADTHEGHMARAEIAAERFGPAAPVPGVSVSSAPAASARNPGSVLGAHPQGLAPAGAAPPADIAPLVEAAVQRQIEPLLERIEEMDSRLRITDVMSGLFLIIGLAGIGLHIRRKRG